MTEEQLADRVLTLVRDDAPAAQREYLEELIEQTEHDAAILVGVNVMREIGITVPPEAATFVDQWLKAE